MTGLRAAHPELAEEASEQADPAAAPWSAEQMLLASLTDSVRYLAWMFAITKFKDVSKQPPEPIPRPGVTPRRKAAMTAEAYRQMTGEEPPLYLVQGGG